MGSVNQNNFSFYNNLDLEKFKFFASDGGFDTWADLQTAWPHIREAGSVIELGAAYGRCLDFFLENNFQDKLIAVEQSPEYADYLREHYGDEADIHEEDLKIFEPDYPVDALLWMWSGILDFSWEEQRQLLNKMIHWLNPGGVLVVDTPEVGVTTWAEHEDPQHLKADTPYGKLECFIPSEEDVRSMAGEAGYREVKTIPYNTRTQKKRTLYIITK